MKFLYLPCFQHASTPACSCAKKCLSSRIKRRNLDLPHMSQISSAICYGSSGLTRSTKRSRSKATWMLHLLHLQWRYLHGERRENYKKRMAMATMFISKQLSWFRNSKAFNEKRSEWIPGKNMDEPWTILTRLSQAQSAHGFGSSQGCLPVCMILIQLDWFHIILISYLQHYFKQPRMWNSYVHPCSTIEPSSSSVLLSTSLVVSGCFRLGMVGSTAPSQRAKVPNDSSEPNSSA